MGIRPMLYDIFCRRLVAGAFEHGIRVWCHCRNEKGNCKRERKRLGRNDGGDWIGDPIRDVWAFGHPLVFWLDCNSLSW